MEAADVVLSPAEQGDNIGLDLCRGSGDFGFAYPDLFQRHFGRIELTGIAQECRIALISNRLDDLQYGLFMFRGVEERSSADFLKVSFRFG
jgi:hypothetical protein